MLTCGSQEGDFWGQLYPVYSPSKGRIYKNGECARCHGVRDGIEWIPIVKCPASTYPLAEILLRLLHEELNCSVGFQPVNNAMSVEMFKCWPEVVNRCYLPGRPFPFHVQGCFSGLYAPPAEMVPAYANYYCALCNRKSVPRYCSFKPYVVQSDDFYNNSTFFLLNPVTWTMFRESERRYEKEFIACPITDDNSITSQVNNMCF